MRRFNDRVDIGFVQAVGLALTGVMSRDSWQCFQYVRNSRNGRVSGPKSRR